MYALKLNWKEFSVSLPDVDTWAKAQTWASSYKGMSGDYTLTLWLDAEPSQADKDAIQTYWDGLTAQSTEATSYVSAEAIKTAYDTLKAGIAVKTWDAMSTAERKIVLGQMPTKTELGL